MKLKKKSILLSFDNEALLQTRKILFKNRLSLQEFFAFICERIVLQDERIELLIEDLRKLKDEYNVKGGVDRTVKVDADSLYDAIEADLEDK